MDAPILAALMIAMSSALALGADIVGKAHVIDGDTISIQSQSIRLEGIDAPETDQVCLNASGKRWTCGMSARDRLSSYIAGRNVSCAPCGEDRYGRTLAVCSVDGKDLNGWMVSEGHALAFTKYSPWDWRHVLQAGAPLNVEAWRLSQGLPWPN